ncbi:hypothetical protein PG984_016435 [Apiospora sp. TS-2023a]
MRPAAHGRLGRGQRRRRQVVHLRLSDLVEARLVQELRPEPCRLVQAAQEVAMRLQVRGFVVAGDVVVVLGGGGGSAAERVYAGHCVALVGHALFLLGVGQQPLLGLAGPAREFANHPRGVFSRISKSPKVCRLWGEDDTHTGTFPEVLSRAFQVGLGLHQGAHLEGSHVAGLAHVGDSAQGTCKDALEERV